MNITLIGMPGAGKSFYGKLLAKELNYAFIDIDALIEAEGMKISELIATQGDQAFNDKEARKILDLHNLTNTIITPGGSCIYSDKAMQHLQKISTIIYLNIPLEISTQRVSQRDARKETPIVGLKEKGWEALYAERTPLYEKYAQITIAQSITTTPEEVITDILRQINSQPKHI